MGFVAVATLALMCAGVQAATHNVSAGESIQTAINGASDGDTIEIGAGVFTENITLNKRVSLIGSGSGSGAGDTILRKSSNAAVLTIAASGTAGSHLVLQDLRVEPEAVYGIFIDVDTDVDYLDMDNVVVSGLAARTPGGEQEVGFWIRYRSSVTNSTFTDCVFENCVYGVYFQKHEASDMAAGGSTASNLAFTNCVFQGNDAKAAYFEKLEDSVFTNCTVYDNGNYVDYWNAAWNAGIDINLKGDETYSNLTFTDCDFTSNALGVKEGAGLMLKGRGTGNDPSYAATPAILDNVLVSGGNVLYNERGIRVGEPGKDNTSPTNVKIEGVDIRGNNPLYAGGDGSSTGGVVNQATSTVDARGNYWGTTDLGVIADMVGGPGTILIADPLAEEPTDVVYSDIQSAVDGASPGDTIIIGPGTFNENVTLDKPVNLIGQGPGVTILDPNSPGITVTTSGASEASSMVIQNMTITGASGGWNTGTGILFQGTGSMAHYHLDNLHIHTNGGHGISFASATADYADVNITSCVVENNGGHGLLVASVGYNSFDGLKVHDSVFHGNEYAGMSLNDSPSYPSNFTNVTLTGTSVTLNNPTGAHVNVGDLMILIEGDVTLNNVYVESQANSYYGLQIRGDGSNPSGIINLTDVTVAGACQKVAMMLQEFTDMNATISGLDLSGVTAPGWAALVLAHTDETPVDLGDAILPYLPGLTIALWNTGGADATGATFVGSPDNFAIEDLVNHGVDWPGAGLVTWVSGEVFVTTYSLAAGGGIQAAIDAADDGDTINVSAGTYNENLDIWHPLSLLASGDVTLDGSGLGLVAAIDVTTGNVTIDGFDILNYGGNGIIVGYPPAPATPQSAFPNVVITNNVIGNIQPGSSHGFGIYCGYEAEGFGDARLTTHIDFTGLVISGNEVYNTANAALVLQSITSLGAPLDVSDNNFHDAGASGCWVDTARNIDFDNNTFDNNSNGVFINSIADGWYAEDGTYGPQNLSFTNNTFSNNSGSGLVLYAGWTSTINVNDSTFAGNGTAVNNTLPSSLDATGNWWGTISGEGFEGGDGIRDMVSGNVAVSPWAADAGFSGTLTPPATAWVDDDWAGSAEGATVGGHTFGYDAFSLVQDGIDNVENSTVNVAAGSYNEALAIDKELDLLGVAGAILDGSGLGATDGVTVSVGAVNIDSLAIQDFDGVGVALTGGATGVTVSNCQIQNNTGDGLFSDAANVDLDLTNNTLSNNGGRGVMVQSGQATVSENAFLSNGALEINKGASAAVDASLNWWGATSPAAVDAEVGADVDYTPWLGVGTDTAPGTVGFQPDTAQLYVYAASAQTGATGRIQEAVNVAGSAEILIASGTYSENVVVNKPIDMTGVTVLTRPVLDGGGVGTGLTLNASPSEITLLAIENFATGVQVTDSANCVINYCDFSGNSTFAVANSDTGTSVDARWCSWGAIDGPSNPPVYTGSGDAITDWVDAIPFSGGSFVDAPEVVSIVPSGDNPIEGSGASFIVTFTLPVQGVELDDFQTNASGGVTGLTLVSVTALPGDDTQWELSYTVAGTNGLAWVDLVEDGDGSIVSIPASQPLLTNFTSGEQQEFVTPASAVQDWMRY